MINDLNFQIVENQTLISRFGVQAEEIEGELPKLEQQICSLKDEYQGLIENGDTVDAALTDISEKIGYQRNQLICIQEKINLCDQIEGLIEKKNDAYAAVDKLKRELSLLEEGTQDRRDVVYNDIEDIAKKMLIDDGGYEPAFEYPEEISFDFAKDKMFVNGRTKFSASSMVIMKNCIRSSIFFHSINDDKSRLPRLLLIDNIEDKGMMPERSQNFQRKLIERFDALEEDYQLIFTTSMIDSELNESDCVIGPFYKKGTHTLNIG